MLDPKDIIKDRLDIVEVIREYVQLKQSGANWKALCPFHNEKSPSFMVSPERKSWHCFGCNKGGDVFSFVMEREGLEFPEVLRMFADRLGIELRRGDAAMRTKKTQLLDVLDAAAEWWHAQLFGGGGTAAREYVKRRGITKEVAQEWLLGYATPEWDGLAKHLVERGYSLADILASGAVIPRERKPGDARLPFYDRFRGRLMFPIHDSRGRVVGAGGRIMVEDPVHPEPKYVNTSETPLYSKSKILYGFHKAKDAIKEKKLAVVVEGYMDVIASHRAGVRTAVGVSGTALTTEHIELLARVTDTVALSFDQDAAGENASRRSIGMLLRSGIGIRVLRLPDGIKDPDECVARDPALWVRAVEESVPLFSALFARAEKENLSDITTKKRIAHDLLKYIAEVKDPVERGHFLRELAQLTNTPERVLYEMLPRAAVALPPSQTSSGAPQSDRQTALSERLLALLLTKPEHQKTVFPALSASAIAAGPLRDLYTDLAAAYTRSDAPHDVSAARPITDRLLFVAEQFFHSFDTNAIRNEVTTTMRALQRETMRGELDDLERRLGSEKDVDAVRRILERVEQLNRELVGF